MEKEAFKHYLQYGYGRILQFLREHDATPYREIILENCLHNTTYDPQSEGSKVPYLYEIIQCTSDEPFYRAALLHAMYTIPVAVQPKRVDGGYLLDDGLDWDASQLFDFALLFAQQGDHEARQAMYHMFIRRATSHCEFGADEIIELDGLDGFLFVALHLQSLRSSDDEKLTDWYIKTVVERFGHETVQQYIEEHTRDNAQLKAYIDYPRAEEQKDKMRNRRSVATYEQIKQQIATWNGATLPAEEIFFSLIRFASWGRRASDEDLLVAAQDFLASVDESMQILPYLTIFRSRRFPLSHDRLLALAESYNEHIAHAALAALEHIAHPDVRALALHLARTIPGDKYVPGLFVHNYQDGDATLIEELLQHQQDIDSIHSVSFAVFDIFEQHPTPNCADSLLYIYEHGPCVCCREKAVKLLLANQVLPAAVAQECLYDSNFEIRELVAVLKPE